MSDSLLHLVFSSSGLLNLPARVGEGDCVVVMPGAHAPGLELNWPCGVRVFSLIPTHESALIGERMIDSRELVALTSASKRILSW